MTRPPELVLFLEELSAKALLETLLPRLLDPRIQYRLIPFEGKQDMDKQLVRKLRAYANPEARFLILRDQDSATDCKALKAQLMARCCTAGKQATSIVRIACRELETLYLADLHAVEKGLGLTGLARQQNTVKFKNPDHLESPSAELRRLTKQVYQKVGSSRCLGPHLDLSNERSLSFKHLVQAIRRHQDALLPSTPHDNA